MSTVSYRAKTVEEIRLFKYKLFAVILMLFGKISDYGTTVIGLEYLNVREANPVASWTIESFGLVESLFWLSVVVVWLIFFVVWFSRIVFEEAGVSNRRIVLFEVLAFGSIGAYWWYVSISNALLIARVAAMEWVPI